MFTAMLIWCAIMFIGLIAGLFMMTSNHYKNKHNWDADLVRAEEVEIAGNTTVGGTLAVTGATTIGGDPAVTLTGTQTLTNKTLTAPTITSPTGVVFSDIGGLVDYTQMPVNAMHFRGSFDAEFRHPYLLNTTGSRGQQFIENTEAPLTGGELFAGTTGDYTLEVFTDPTTSTTFTVTLTQSVTDVDAVIAALDAISASFTVARVEGRISFLRADETGTDSYVRVEEGTTDGLIAALDTIGGVTLDILTAIQGAENTAGDQFYVTEDGTVDFGAGAIDLVEGDSIIRDADDTFFRAPNYTRVTSVFTRTGDVVATQDDYAHSQLSGIATDDHHARYADSEAQAAVPWKAPAQIAVGTSPHREDIYRSDWASGDSGVLRTGFAGGDTHYIGTAVETGAAAGIQSITRSGYGPVAGGEGAMSGTHALNVTVNSTLYENVEVVIGAGPENFAFVTAGFQAALRLATGALETCFVTEGRILFGTAGAGAGNDILVAAPTAGTSLLAAFDAAFVTAYGDGSVLNDPVPGTDNALGVKSVAIS